MEQIDNDSKFEEKNSNDFEKGFIEEISNLIEESDDVNDFEELINSLFLDYVNQERINRMMKFLQKLNENSSSRMHLQKFLSFLENSKIHNGNVKNLLTKSLIKFIHENSHIREENNSILTIKILADGRLCDLKNLKSSHVEKICNFVKYKTSFDTNFEKNLLNLFSANGNKLNYVFLLGKILKLKIFSSNTREQFQKIFLEFYENFVLDDDDKEKNLSKQRYITDSLSNIDESLIYKVIFPRCESLLLRTNKNFKFLENVFTYLTIEYNDEFTQNLFKTFYEYFFSLDKTIFEASIESFKKISKNSNLEILIKNLLAFNFSADKSDLNINISFFLVCLVNKGNTIASHHIVSIGTFLLKTLESVNENNKAKFETIFEEFIKGLLNLLKLEQTVNKEDTDNLNKQLKKLISSSSYAYFFNYFYLLITFLTEKVESYSPTKEVSDCLFNNMQNLSFTSANSRMVLTLISAAFTVTNKKIELFTGNNKKIFTAALNCMYESSTNYLYTKNNFLNLHTFEFVSIINVYKQIMRNETLKSFYNEELHDLSKLIACSLFRKNKKSFELNCVGDFIQALNDKQLYDNLINESITYIIRNEHSATGASLNLPIHYCDLKISFNNLKSLVERYAELFYQEFNEKDFLKFIILAHIPNLNNDIHFEHYSDSKNGFLTRIYKKYSSLESNKDIHVQIQDNFKELSSFIFSHLGLFNQDNKIIVNSCYNLITRLFEVKSHPEFVKDTVKATLGSLDVAKFKYIDNLSNYYEKQVDYISFYDLAYLIESIKKLEDNCNESMRACNDTKKEAKTSSNTNLNLAMLNATKQSQAKGKPQQGKNVKANTGKNEKVDKVDKESQLTEYKNYLANYLIKLNLKSNFVITRLQPIIDLLNNEDLHRDNFKFCLKSLWSLLKVKALNSNIKNNLQEIFSNNSLVKEFSNEFSSLMLIEANPDLFDEILEAHPNLIITFNSKMEKLMLNETKRERIFEFFDFIIVKLLFFVILNNNISNDDKVASVNVLIQIIEKLPKSVLNFNDISMLAVSLLKTSYNDENLETLLEIFLTRAKEENFLVLCDDILEYEYVAKVTFLRQILQLNLFSLRKYKNLMYKLWILIFDENDNISQLATKIWNKFNLFLDSNFIHSKEFLLAFTNHVLKDSINHSIRAFAFLFKNETNHILESYKEFYEKELNSEVDHNEEEGNEDEIQTNRVILFDFVNETIELLSSKLKQSLLDFLMRVSDKEFSEEIFVIINKTIFIIIKSINDEKLIENILSSIEKNIKLISQKNLKDINYKNLTIILMMLNSILINTLENNNLKHQKESLYDSLYSLSVKLTNTDVLCHMSSCYQYLAMNNKDKSEALFQKIIENFKNSKDKLMNLGEMYVLTGLVKCFGIRVYRDEKIEEMILDNMKKNKLVTEKQNAIILVKVFSETLKKLYEPYLVSIFDQICELIADREEKVRETTQHAIKKFMKNISGFGVKTIMPRLIKDLHAMNWRSKVVNIEILGQFAFCAPKQLSIYIPKVIKEIMQVLKDPHNKVQETAVAVLKDISSVIKNPEIVELGSLLIDAIANPFENSKNALTALLETDFKHAIDPPSLALIIPIVDYNLKVQNENFKKMSAHLIGSLANLISNPMDLYQYIDIINSNIKAALFDSIPECRNAIAKAIGSLAKNLGIVYLQEMLNWLKTYIENEADTVQKSGSAQAYAEILVSMGEKFMEKYILHIISKIQEGNSVSKEGYLSIFVFLPGCLGEKFEKYFELIFPLIIDGFSDDHENVRNVSNKIFEICIRLFAKRNTKQLIDPLLIRLFDRNWRIRNSSIALIKTLVLNLNKEFFKENSTFFTKEQRDDILINTFILKADHCGNTSTIANMIWRDYVDNIPKYLSRVLKQIYEQLINLLSGDNDECFDIAEGLIKMLVSKFSDKFFMELMPIIKENIIEKKDDESIVYASFYIIQLAVTEASEKLLSGYREKIIRIVYDNLFTSISSVRKLFASIIFEISKKFYDHNLMKNFIHNVMKHARNKSFEEQKNLLEIVSALVEISGGEVLHYVINEIFRKPYEEGFINLASLISSDIADNIKDPTELKELYASFLEALDQAPNSTVDSIVNVTQKLDEKYLPIFADTFDKLKTKAELSGDYKTPTALHLSEVMLRFVESTSQDLSSISSSIVEILVSLLIFDIDDCTINCGLTLKLLIERLDKSLMDKTLDAFMTRFAELEEKMDWEKIDKVQNLGGKFKLIMDNLLFLVQNFLLYAENKKMASDYVQKIIDYTSKQTMKSYIMKMIGPMIRILSEKFTPQIKESVLDNIKSLIIKSKEDVKGISPQLQSVLIKTLIDTSQPNSERAQLKAGDNILRLLQYYPRTDVTVNDIMKSITIKIDKNETMLAVVEIEILSDIIRFYGHTLKPNVITEQYEKILNLINNKQDTPFDYLVLLLSSYTKTYQDIAVCEKQIENTMITEELPRKLFNFLCIFNGNLNFFNLKKKNAIYMIKSLSKDQSVILLKSLGKIVNKYKYFLDFDKEKITEVLKNYEKTVENILIETDLLNASNNILDANLCVFILSLGYLKNYETNQALFTKVFNFLLALIKQTKVNSQLLLNCLSLLILKEIMPNPDSDTILATLEDLEIETEDIEIVDEFLKKIYYLYGN